jgi:hypothetical protein
MNGTLKFLAEALSARGGTKSEYRWEDFLDVVEAVFAGPFDWEAEKVMLAVLRFDGRLQFSESSELPHSMPPEDMLKSFAIQWLAKETGLIHLLEMQRVEATATSPALASIVRAAIRGTTPPKLPARQFQVIPEIRSVPRHEVVIGPLGQNIARRPAKALPQGKRVTAEKNAVTLEHDTKYDFGWMPLSGSDTTSRMLVFKGHRGVVSWPSRKRNIINKAVIYEHGLTFFANRGGKIKRVEEELAFA